MRFTHEQRQAIACAVLDDDHTMAQAIEAAARGEFGLTPFTISAATAQRILASERDCRRSPTEIAADVERRIMALCRRELSRLEQLPQLGVDDALALQRLEETTRSLREAAPVANDDAELE